MKHYHYILIITILSLMTCKNERFSDEVLIAKKEYLFSKILNEKRELLIHIPHEYNTNYPKARYPVLYVLDPEAHFLPIAGIIDRLSTNIGEEICPQMIIVGIKNTERVRDMFPINDEDNFQKFMEQELIPYIEKKYPTRPFRLLYGHSITGLRTVHTAIFNEDLFNAYIAIDPSLCHEYCEWYEKFNHQITNFELKTNRMFIAMANTMNGKDTIDIKKDTSGNASHMNSIMNFANLLSKKNNSKKLFSWKYYPDYSHNGVTLQATLDGFESIFSWYKNDSYNIIFDDESTPEQAIKAFINHYEKLSEVLGYTEIPRQELVSNIVWYLTYIKKKPEIAVLFAQMNLKNYPQSQPAKEQLKQVENEIDKIDKTPNTVHDDHVG